MDLESENNEKIQELKKEILELTEKRFKDGATVYYLSKLGNDLGRDVIEEITSVTGGKLLEFVRDYTELNPERSEKNPQVYFVRSPDAPKIDPADMPSRKIYDRNFWKAFRDPNTNSEQRMVNLSTGEVRRGGQGRELSGDWAEIEDSFLSEGVISDIETAKRIESWIEEKGANEKIFLKKGSSATVSGKTALSILIDALSSEERKRVSLPLDIVKSLQDRNIE